MTTGSMRDVYNGKADKTAGGLVKKDIFFDSKSGTYKSKARSSSSKGNPWAESVGIWMRSQPKGTLIPKKGSSGYKEIMAIKSSLV